MSHAGAVGPVMAAQGNDSGIVLLRIDDQGPHQPPEEDVRHPVMEAGPGPGLGSGQGQGSVGPLGLNLIGHPRRLSLQIGPPADQLIAMPCRRIQASLTQQGRIPGVSWGWASGAGSEDGFAAAAPASARTSRGRLTRAMASASARPLPCFQRRTRLTGSVLAEQNGAVDPSPAAGWIDPDSPDTT